ncbi:EAL domain-containing response regulator [Trichlorobacter lovleyi]|uniref:Response regulator receiver modulated diguanylate cyclase/phosphodiesterase with PAS/PAC sensor(S) n=1 Tax=Trichlorobacter lovleyi (strain ATCC BAA-1151 / DSM 17278 / SZ) TaxID=398767 RepID=B3E415_TRIL1|nr:EAL domain-containing protein [Trichlorobacter lovleyi]ACD94429.1 response regulator receiver modulated diguanylate cyclase/phosphodiesterase with PAS/PAC sensor(s) [Trichlorobacter lovleyi SZ]
MADSDGHITSGMILIVEDNIPFGELVAGTLREDGYQCHTVSTGAAALIWLASHPVNLLLLDYTLVDMTGEAFIAAMAEQGSQVPFVVVTGRDDSNLAVQMIKQGASDFVVKDTALLDRLPVVVSRTLQEAATMQRLCHAEQALRQSELRLARAQRIARIGSWEWDLQSNGLYFSPELFSILGYDGTAPPDVSLEWFYRQINPSDTCFVRKALSAAIESGRNLNQTFRIVTCSGEEIVVASQAELEYDSDGRPELLVGTLLDVTDRTRAEQEIHHLANYDTLTGLPNRNLLHDRLQQAIVQAARVQGSVGVLFLDLDRFKGVNELLGHRAGDQLLRTVAERLRVCVRESDTLARAGGDEFVIILSVVSDEDGISSAASKILAIISEPFVIEERELYLTASIGVAVYPTDGADVQSLLKHADLAMYQAKDMDRNNFQFFSSDLNVKVMERMVLESSLRRALERDEFQLLYQPQVDVITGSVVGFEALLRWHHPDLGTISPEKFIPLAEETGLILSIGEWVLRTACRQAKIWQDAGLRPVRMAVNLSGRQFRMKLDEIVAAILLETGFDPRWLELELTESILMRNASDNIELLQALTAMGCSLSIDDFGTGYSSLAYLKHFPLERLKIDRSFVRDVTTNPDDRAIAKIIIDMAHTLKMEVTAEGVEEREQLELLKRYGCREMQGFFFSRPVPAASAEKLLRKGITF